MQSAEFIAEINDGKIEIPLEYRNMFNSNVKVILFDTGQYNTCPKETEARTAKGFGALSHRADPGLWEQEENAWERAVVKKYGSG